MSVDPNSTEARVKLVDEHVQAEVERDLDKIMETWGENPDFDDVPWDEQFAGRDGIRHHYEELLTAFPDLDIVVHDRHVTDRLVILEVTVTGTHLGDWRDLPATGGRMESRVCALYGFDETGMLALERTYYDKAKILEQLGIFADPRTTTGKVMAVITPPFAILRTLAERLLRRVKS
ncbi:MAG TPA: ester cyclase [Gaiellaceae bacterium]|nr:ester cyclase [Gaiellaceae bacterium]